jgi:distribution and morphology protein 10
VYSYESDLSVGGEWWIGRRRGKREVPTTPSLEEQRKLESKRAALQEASLREDRFDTVAEVESLSSKMSNQSTVVNDTVPPPEERDGVLKARISGDWVSFRIPRNQADRSVDSTIIRSPYTEMLGFSWSHLGLA